MGGWSHPAPKAPALRHTGALKPPDWGGFSQRCLGSLSRAERLWMCHVKQLPPQGETRFLPEHDLSRLSQSQL